MLAAIADQRARARAERALQLVPHGVGGARVNDWTNVRLLQRRIAHLQRARVRDHELAKGGQHALVHKHAFRRRAPLAGGSESAVDRLPRRECEVGVGQHNQRVVAAELKEQALVAGLARDRAPGGHRAGQVDARHVGAGRRLPQLGLVGHAQLQRVARDAGLVANIEQRARRQVALRVRLEHDGAAGGERGAELVRGEVDGEIKGAHGEHHAQRPRQNERELVFARTKRVGRLDFTIAHCIVGAGGEIVKGFCMVSMSTDEIQMTRQRGR